MRFNNSRKTGVGIALAVLLISSVSNHQAIGQSAADAVENAPLQVKPAPAVPAVENSAVPKGKAFGSSLAKPLVGDPTRPDAAPPPRTFQFTGGFGYDAQSQKIFDMLYSGHGTNHPIGIEDTEPKANAQKEFSFADDKEAQKDLHGARNSGHWDPDFNQAGYNLQQLKDCGPAPSAFTQQK
jgi:hypothetical protein